MDAVRIRSQGQSARRAKRCQSLVTSVFAADWNLTHFDEVKVDHLGEDGGFAPLKSGEPEPLVASVRPLVRDRCRTFTWFSFSLLWFWSNWTQLGAMAGSVNVSQMIAIWIWIFLASSIVLAMWEAARQWLLSIQFEGRPLIASRYARTVWCTVWS